MSSAFKCSPPFHPDPGVTKPLLRASTWYRAHLLETSAEYTLRGGSSAQRVSENISRGGATKYSTWEACLPAWHACCDAGEHAHPCLPIPATPVPQQPPVTPTMDRSLRPPTDSINKSPCRSHPCTCVLSRSPPPLAHCVLAWPPSHSEPLLPAGSSAPMRSYVVQGRGTIYTSLEAALVDFRAAGAAGPATLYMTDDAAVAWNVAMGRSPEEAIQLQLAEAIGEWCLMRLLTMPPDAQKELDRLRDLPDDETVEWEDDDNIALEDVLDGTVPITISHGGGEIADMERELSEELHGKKKRKRKDTRNRWDVLQRRVNGFRAQMEAMVDAFTKFTVAQEGCMDRGPPPVPPEMIEQEFSLPTIHHLFRLYLEILQNVELRVKKALGRDADDWRLKNGCPACTYKLEGEEKMIFEMLCACDGNDSLKRILRKDKGVDEDGVPLRGDSQRPDPRAESAGGDYFLTREAVNRWVKERLAAEVKLPTNLDPEEESVCQERWKNLSEELTSKMWGIFDETGIFVALCRHGFVLLVADMVRSGELAKYPLAIENALMDAFGKDIGLGYDIGCGHETTIKNSPLAAKAKAMNLKMLVGAFHGHAHNRRCQLVYLATYVLGLGLEDMETCERLFSKTNGLARSVRYASVFHRKQTIRTYFAHLDTFETYANLSTFLVNNYKQAIEIIDKENSLRQAMEQAGITEDMLNQHLEDEKAYLDKLSKEPAIETDQMEYYQQLVNLNDRRCVFPHK
ncbi:hypothetical protein B0H12DRAFT_1243562 [Mycena haematopus]|nr:hypothetical protein B0H12DRAFT_1243562 [Mycena haematopus]